MGVLVRGGLRGYEAQGAGCVAAHAGRCTAFSTCSIDWSRLGLGVLAALVTALSSQEGWLMLQRFERGTWEKKCHVLTGVKTEKTG